MYLRLAVNLLIPDATRPTLLSLIPSNLQSLPILCESTVNGLPCHRVPKRPVCCARPYLALESEARKPRALSTSALFVLKYASTPNHDKQAQSSTAPQRSKTERDCVGREAWPKVCAASKRQAARKGQGKGKASLLCGSVGCRDEVSVVRVAHWSEAGEKRGGGVGQE